MLRNGVTRMFKIGRTIESAEKRRRALTTGNPVQLHIVSQWNVPDKLGEFERFVHLTFAENRIRASDATEFFNFAHLSDHELISKIDCLHGTFCKRIEAIESSDSKQTDTALIEADASVQSLIDRHRKIATQIKLLQIECSEVDALLKKKIRGNAGVQALGRERPLVTWKTTESERFDVQKFKLENPEAYADYTNKIMFRTFRVFD